MKPNAGLGTHFDGLGLLSTLDFTVESGQVTLKYSNPGPPPFATSVTCMCNPNKGAAKRPTFVFQRTDFTTLVFKLVHICCCPDGCKNGLPSSGGEDGGGGGGQLSYGSIISIVLASVCVLYFIFGVMMRRRLGSRGVESIPNHAFWAELPSLVRDGAYYLLIACKGSRGYSYIP